MSTAVRSEANPTQSQLTYHRPALRMLATRTRDEMRSRMLSPLAVCLGLALWAAIISAVLLVA